MTMLPAAKRANILWFRVHPGREGYERLPNHGLVVEYVAGAAGAGPLPLEGHLVLYFDGRVQPDSNLIFSRYLDRYLTVVPHGFQYDQRENGRGVP